MRQECPHRGSCRYTSLHLPLLHRCNRTTPPYIPRQHVQLDEQPVSVNCFLFATAPLWNTALGITTGVCIGNRVISESPCPFALFAIPNQSGVWLFGAPCPKDGISHSISTGETTSATRTLHSKPVQPNRWPSHKSAKCCLAAARHKCQRSTHQDFPQPPRPGWKSAASDLWTIYVYRISLREVPRLASWQSASCH